MHPVMQMQQQVPSPRHFEHLRPFHDHLKPEQFAALQQQQHQHHQQQLQQMQQQQQQQQQQHHLQSHYQYLSQSRATRPQSASAPSPYGSTQNTVNSVPQQSFPIRSTQATGLATNHQNAQPSNLHSLNHHAHANVHFAPAGSAVARNPTAYPLAAERFQEHHLRRKTPNGTIDAGYDGSHAGLASGPPPLKQMAMSASSRIFPTPVISQNATQMAPAGNSTSANGSWPMMAPNGAPPANAAVNAAANAGATNMANSNFNMSAISGDQASAMLAQQMQQMQQMQQVQQMQSHDHQRANGGMANGGNALFVPPGVFSPSYQASPGPTAFNSPSFDSQSIWSNSALLQGYQPQSQPFLLNNMRTPGTNIPGTNMANSNGSLGNLGLVPQNIACDSAFISAAQPMFSPPGIHHDGIHQLAVPPGQQAAAMDSFRSTAQAQALAIGQAQAQAQAHAQAQAQVQAQVNMAAHSENNTPNDIKMTSPNALPPAVPALSMMGAADAAATAMQGLALPGDSPNQFKERVLAHAEKAYSDLLYCLMHTKKSINGRPMPSLRPRNRPNVYAKVGQLPQQQQQQQQQQQKQAQEFQMRQSQAQAQAYAQAQIQAQAALATSDQVGNHVQQGLQAAGVARMAQINRYQQAIQKGYGFNAMADMNAIQAPLMMQAKAVLEVLSSLCEQDNWKWIEGMLLGACLYYALENFEQALEWFKRIYALRPDFIEVLSNIAATLHCLDRREEAIKYWFLAVRTKPSYLESAEHLTAVLSSAQRHRDAVEVITLVQNSLRIKETDNSPTSTGGATDNTPVKTEPVDGSDPALGTDTEKDKEPDSIKNTPFGFGSSGYAIPASDNGRMLGLVHMKANILYALKDIAAASDAYEEAVLISVGRPIRSVQDLIRKVRGALSTDSPTPNGAQKSSPPPPSGPPLLTPEMARMTSVRTFSHTGGQLPGLVCIVDLFQLKAAIATASNALLSMAKILQDAMATSSYAARGGGSQSTAVGDILSLYYLSMSLQESPSTANNVGILLASVQQAPVPKAVQAQRHAEALAQHQKLTLQYQQKQLFLRQQLQKLQQQQSIQTPQQGAQRQAQNMQPAQKLQQMQQMQQMRTALPKTGGVVNTTAEALAIPAGITPGSSLALAFAYYNYGLKLDPKHVHLHTNLGSLLKDVGHLDLAIKMYEQAVSCDGTFDIALTNLANAVKDRGRVSEAIMYYRRAVTSNPEFTEAVCGLSTALNSVCDWAGRGGVVLYNGRFDRWHVNESGMLEDVRNNYLGSGLMQRVVNIVARQLKEASTWGQGILHESQIAMLASQMKDAAGTADGDSGSALAIRDPLDGLDVAAELKKWAGQPWEGSRVLRLIERATRVAMRRWYYDRHILGVESPKGYIRPRAPASLSVPGAPTVLPFHTFTCPLPAKEVRLISQRNALRISSSTLRMPWLSTSVYPPPAPPKPHLNIGYISSDFNNHPLAHLMQSVFGFHDQTRAKAFCYATTASDKSVHRQKIEREAPVFRDVTNWPAERLIEQIIQDGIHILVNLNGYTRGARNEIFAARPAPIQMSFMGFAGTLGAEWCDYLLADTMAVPPSTLRPYRGNVSIGDVFHDEAAVDEEKWIYSENLIYSRDTFFCCDHKQSADPSERTLTWKDEMQRRWKMRKELFPDLPDDAIILGNFNQLYKIDPTTFRSWLRILANVPKAVLWLLRFPDLGETNLRKTAVQWGNQSIADRIIFTDVAPKHLHITRARVCDLFLDTPECNAHTTAADVLWSSTPIVTLPRYEYKMCSRIGASVLKGALPKDAQGQQAASELIADDEDQYEKLAIKLANSLSYRLIASDTSLTGETYGEGHGRLAEIRQLLWQHKWSCGLFDTKRWVSDLEDAYDAAWGNWVSGKRGDIYL